MKKVLLLGAAGQLGGLICQNKPDNVVLQASTKSTLDITDLNAIKSVIERFKPDLIINSAAYTAVDNAEHEAKKAYLVNRDAVANIAKSAPQSTSIIHLSTDFVFSLSSKHPYSPEDPTSPVSVYGQSKLAGEKALLAYHPENSVIIRTSWLYSAKGKNFVTTMLRLMKTKDELNIVSDQLGSPTSALGLADVIWTFADMESVSGVYHWSDRGVISWYDFAMEIKKQAIELELLERDININPIPSSAFPSPAVRPEYSALDASKTETILGKKSKPWQEQLLEVLKEIKRQT